MNDNTHICSQQLEPQPSPKTSFRGEANHHSRPNLQRVNECTNKVCNKLENSSEKSILAIDQGTTSTRAILYNTQGIVLAKHQICFKQYFPNDGWVEHDADEIWESTLLCCRAVLEKANVPPENILGIGISNQRETTILWDKVTGKVIGKAIVWQDRRTEPLCKQLLAENHEPWIKSKTGLLIDPYFSATKISWLIEHYPEANTLISQGNLAFGTIDCFLLWRFTNGKAHATDASNASRTLLFNLKTQTFDPELLTLFNIPPSILPEIKDNADCFGFTDKSWFGKEIPILAMAGDQQAALIGQACFKPGMLKSTYGTGLFMLMNTGETIIHSQNRLISTVAYRLKGKITYGIEGSVFIAGAAVQWLKDTLHLIQNANDCERMAESLQDNGNVYLVPAFTGLGAPYWDPNARGAILGLTRDTHVEHIVRAALEAVCYQTRDLIEAMKKDGAHPPHTMRVDGGMTVNHWLMQFLADILDLKIEQTPTPEVSALGVASLVALQAEMVSSLDELSTRWSCEHEYSPQISIEKREKLYHDWLKAVQRVC